MSEEADIISHHRPYTTLIESLFVYANLVDTDNTSGFVDIQLKIPLDLFSAGLTMVHLFNSWLLAILYQK